MDLEDLISKFITGGGAGKVAAGSSSAEEKKLLQVLTAVHSRHLLSKRLFEGVVPGEYVV